MSTAQDLESDLVAFDVVRIRLHLRAVTVVGVVIGALRELVVEAEGLERSRICSGLASRCYAALTTSTTATGGRPRRGSGPFP